MYISVWCKPSGDPFVMLCCQMVMFIQKHNTDKLKKNNLFLKNCLSEVCALLCICINNES